MGRYRALAIDISTQVSTAILGVVVGIYAPTNLKDYLNANWIAGGTIIILLVILIGLLKHVESEAWHCIFAYDGGLSEGGKNDPCKVLFFKKGIEYKYIIYSRDKSILFHKSAIFDNKKSMGNDLYNRVNYGAEIVERDLAQF